MSDSSMKTGPSRKACEDIIRRILMTEVLETGSNRKFKKASDFMKYFESLYPAGPGLTKQVQRAVNAMELPKDENGFFIVNKTANQLAQDKEISALLQKTHAKCVSFESYETLFLTCDSSYKTYLFQLLSESETLTGKYISLIDSSNGILFLTENRMQLKKLLENMM